MNLIQGSISLINALSLFSYINLLPYKSKGRDLNIVSESHIEKFGAEFLSCDERFPIDLRIFLQMEPWLRLRSATDGYKDGAKNLCFFNFCALYSAEIFSFIKYHQHILLPFAVKDSSS